VSEAGLARPTGEDAADAGRWLFAVADGLGGRFASVNGDHTIGHLDCDVAFPRRCSHGTRGGSASRPADTGLRAVVRYLLGPADSARSQATDRTVLYQLSRAALVGAPSSWPP
jgi:hypothetical protein